MASGVNKVILVGNLGSDPEIRHLPSGTAVASFSIATTESYTTKEGERVDQTEWHRIELWDGLARIAEQYLTKGKQVYIEGKLKTDSWQDNDGNKRSMTKIRGLNMVLLGSRPSTDQSSSYGGSQTTDQSPASGGSQTPDQQTPAQDQVNLPGGETDDLPF